MLHPNTVVPSSNTLRRAVNDEAINTGAEIHQTIPRNIQIHLATDTWTSTNGLAFAGTTIHYIDKDWKLQEHVIGFQPLGASSHTGVFLAQKLDQLIGVYDLRNRMLCLVTDNAQTNMVMARELQKTLGKKWNHEQYHLPCLAHVLALCSKAFMEHLKSQPSNDSFDHNPNLDGTIAALANYPPGSFGRCVFKVSSLIVGLLT